MESGFLVDNTHGGVTQAEWAEGPPVRSIWTGLKMRGKEKHPVTTFRCVKCGYLESYARTADE